MCLNPVFTNKRRSNYKEAFSWQKDIDWRPTAALANNNNYIQLPCGKCPDCRQMTANDWVTRLVLQQEQVEQTPLYKKGGFNTYFITLTYDDLNVPRMHVSNDHDQTVETVLTLRKRDVQQFVIDLKTALFGNKRKTPIKYFYAGEYGGLNGRPHYHLIIYNVPKLDLYNTRRHGSKGEIWTSELVQALWNKGITQIDTSPVKSSAFAYVAGYVKKADQQEWHPQSQAPFQGQSHGLGMLSIEQIIRVVEKKTPLQIVVTDPKTKIARIDNRRVPRYYVKRYIKHIKATLPYNDSAIRNLFWNVLKPREQGIETNIERLLRRRNQARHKKRSVGRAVSPLSIYRPLPQSGRKNIPTCGWTTAILRDRQDPIKQQKALQEDQIEYSYQYFYEKVLTDAGL